MATGEYPSINDREWNLVQKTAWNFYETAVEAGVSGLNPPSPNDNKEILLKKITYYTAALAEA